MKSKQKYFLLILAMAITAILALTSCAGSKEPQNAAINSEVLPDRSLAIAEDTFGVEIKPPAVISSNEGTVANAADVVFISGRNSEYIIIHGASGKDASKLSDTIYGAFKADIPYERDTKAEVAKEILIGETNRALSAELKATVDAIADNGKSYAYGYAVKNGKLALYASGIIATEYLFNDIEKIIFSADGITLKEGLFIVKAKSVAEYEAELKEIENAKAEAEYKKRLEKALAGLEAYKGSAIFRTDLGSYGYDGDDPNDGKHDGKVYEGAELMPSDAYPDPLQYPTYGEHPRILVNTDTVETVRALFNNPPEELAHLVENVKKLADYDFDGTFEEIPGKTYTYNTSLFKYMEAKAFMYLMTGDRLYGYEAILCAKNCILTMVYTEEIFKDTYRGASHAISIITEIYDWCYDLMTEEDKQQIIDGTRFYLFDTLEFKYPPSNMGYVSGHGMSYQFLREYLGFSLAIYDERPDWWDYVGGRFYSQYCLPINYCVKSGYYSQGTTCYLPGKLFNIYNSSWLVKCATGKYPYNDGLQDVPYYVLSQLMPNGKMFEYGDSPTTGNGASIDPAFMIIATGMYNDPTVYAAAKSMTDSFTKLSADSQGDRITHATALIFLAECAGSTEKFAENLPLIEYTGSPAGITVAREAWNDPDSVAVFMKVGELNMSNHDHRDSGTFQIYYKGLLAPANAGQYNVYGSQHWKYYHQATISDNGLLVFDPDLYEEPKLEPLYDANNTQMKDDFGNPMYKVLNPEKALYTGSQRAIGEASSFEALLSSSYNYGTITGHAEGYNQDNSAKFAYLAGDITNAYNATSASYVGRSMLTVFTGDPDYPMYFFVYDNVAPLAGDTDVQMKFLLHSVTEPVSTANGVKIENGEGQLVLINTTGDSIESIGGPGKKYWINGMNLYEDSYSKGLSTGSLQTNDSEGKLWGRTEVTANVGEIGNSMLNVMYVADKGQNVMLSAISNCSGNFTGAVIGNTAAFFADNSTEYGVDAVSVTVASENALMDYYFCGLETGTWSVYEGEGNDKKLLGSIYASSTTHMVAFRAPAGTLTLEPGSDIKPPNSGKIIYQNITEDITEPKYYSYDGITELPKTAKNGNGIFLGWYLDSEFTKPIKEIDGSLYQGKLTVYAKFKFMYANENYDWAKDSPINTANFARNDITYGSGEDDSVNYKSEYKNGKGYIIWTGKTGGPIIGISNSQTSISSLESTKITYTFSLAKNGSDTLLGTGARIVTGTGKKNNTLPLFSTSTNGNLSLCGKTIALTEEFFTFSIVVDFSNNDEMVNGGGGTLTAYTADGELIGSSVFAPLEDAKTAYESKALFGNNVINWRNNGAGGNLATIRIGRLAIEEGDFITSPDECLHTDINDDGKCDRCKTGFNDGCEHKDTDDNGKCDKCNEAYDDGCNHKDVTDDGKCDKCNIDFEDGCETCRDANDDGKCDRCKSNFKDGCDNHKDEDDDLKCDICKTAFDDGCNHFDKDDNGKCDKCNNGFEDGCDNHRDKDDDGKCDNGGEDYDDGEELPAGQYYINYVLPEGVILPEEAPTIHKVGTRTLLPADFAREGYTFVGWYLDKEYTQAVDYFEKSHEGAVLIYPRWNRIFISEDYAWAENEAVDSGEKFGKNGISYGADKNYTSIFTSGKGHLVWTGESDRGTVMIGNLDTVNYGDARLTYTVSLAKDASIQTMPINFRLIGRDPDATANKELKTIFSTTKDGVLKLPGIDINLTEQLQTFSITVDFEAGIMYSYNAEGKLIGQAGMGTAPISNGIDTWLEWRSHLTNTFNCRNNNISGSDAIIKIGCIAVCEGGVGEKYVQNIPEELPEGTYWIKYELFGGTLPEGSADRYTAGTAQPLPETVNYENSSISFAGWYSDKELTQKITEIPTDAKEDFKVYAKTITKLYSSKVTYVDDKTTGTLIMNRYCADDRTDVNSDGICDTCRYCIGHTDADTVDENGNVTAEGTSDGFCDICGYKVTRCSAHSDVHTIDGAGKLVTENVTDGICDICGRNPGGAATTNGGTIGNGMTVQTCDQPYGYAKVIDNGDADYLHIEGNYSGSLLNISGVPEIKAALATNAEKALTYRIVFGCYGDNVLNSTIRAIFRKEDDSGNTAATLICISNSNGKIALKSQAGAVITTFDYGSLVDVSFVINFDDKTISYHLQSSSEPALTESFGYDCNRGSAIFQNRITGTGELDVEAIEIYSGNKFN